MNDRLSLLLVTVVALAWASAARASDDWQYWNQLVLKHKFNDRFALSLTSEQKFEDDFSHFYLYNFTVLPTVRLAEGVTLGAGYRRDQTEQDDQWEAENRLLFPLTFTWSRRPWTFRWRNQLEYRDQESGVSWRLRERLLAQRPVTVAGFTVAPFAAEEVFYDFTAGEVDQNRLTAGLSFPAGESVSLHLYYANRAQKDGDWTTTNILGTEIDFEF
jgi:hypothetical protein